MKGRIALISDIHSNLEALETVLEDITDEKIERIICLGDIIGYGPNPREVLKKAANFGISIRGNHEDALLFSTYDFTPDAVKAIEWTRKEINREEFSKEENHQLWNFIDSLKDIHIEDDIMFVHGSPRFHTREYIMPHDIYDKELMNEIFSIIPRLCFVGHTHIPGIFTEDFTFLPLKFFANRFNIDKSKKYIINVGSVGQPRDGNPQACYVILDGNIVRFKKVVYDYKRTMDKIRSTGGIPVRFAERLEYGR
jgi:predicted phosphodiesterase